MHTEVSLDRTGRDPPLTEPGVSHCHTTPLYPWQYFWSVIGFFGACESHQTLEGVDKHNLSLFRILHNFILLSSKE